MPLCVKQQHMFPTIAKDPFCFLPFDNHLFMRYGFLITHSRSGQLDLTPVLSGPLFT